MKRSMHLFSAVVVVLAFACGGEALGWAPETRVRMVEDALDLMPESLRLVLERHEAEILRAALGPLTAEGSPPHLAPQNGGALPTAIAARVDNVVAAVDAQQPFSEVARRLGDLAHYVADAGFPPNAASNDGASHYEHFAALVRDRQKRIPFVFYGHDSEALARDDLEAYVTGMIDRAREEDDRLRAVYAEAGDPPSPAFFDDRSVPFAIASLAYSRSVTDIVRVWLHAWKKAHGDIGRTPYLDTTKHKK